MTFGELGLCPAILSALEEQNYQKPSPIQEKAIPPALAGKDVLGIAQTGTGKTCAFATPILQRLGQPAPGRPVRTLILTPTRELALQIQENIVHYGKHLPLKSAVIFGGVAQGPQVLKLKQGVDILVATPGRLTDLYQQKLLNLSKIEVFVLDEADRMLDMGFIHDVKKILKWLPTHKQTLFFSATMPPEITDLVNSLLHDPVKVEVTPVSSPVEVITQELFMVDKHNKSNLLAHLMEERDMKTALVFTRTKHGANKVAKDLEKAGISAAAIHGNKSQTARQQALSDFKLGKIRCLVATDIAARGIDIDSLNYVFNYNLPEVPETYVHRIGRTGRAGREGVAIAFCDFGEKPLLKDIQRLMGKQVPEVADHPYPLSVFEAPKRDARGRIVNTEDEEARNAARERRRARDEENKAKAKERRTQSNQNIMAGGEKGKSAQGRQEGKPRRGVRSGQMMDTGSAMPDTQVSRPDPFASDQVMDATARLLAPRGGGRSNHAHSTHSQGGQHGQGKRQNSHRQGKESHGNHGEGHHPKPQRQSNRNQADHARNQLGQGEKSSHITTKNGKGNRNPRQSGGNPRNGGRNSRPPRNQFDTPPHAASTKDSTEQSSLMKPFYLEL